jgi:hypothetical protein
MRASQGQAGVLVRSDIGDIHFSNLSPECATGVPGVARGFKRGRLGADVSRMGDQESPRDRRWVEDRRRFPRTRFCEGCGARLFVDRRGPTLIVRSPVPYATACGPLVCPMCGEPVRLSA